MGVLEVERCSVIEVVDELQAITREARKLSREHEEEGAVVELVAFAHQVPQPQLPFRVHGIRPHERVTKGNIIRPPLRPVDVTAHCVVPPRACYHECDKLLQSGSAEVHERYRVPASEQQRQIGDHVFRR